MSESRKITLGGKVFDLPALTLDQLEALSGDLQRMNPLTTDGVTAIRKCLAVSLAGQIDNAELGKLPVELGELDEAQTALAEISGLRPLVLRLADRYAASRSTGPT